MKSCGRGLGEGGGRNGPGGKKWTGPFLPPGEETDWGKNRPVTPESTWKYQKAHIYGRKQYIIFLSAIYNMNIIKSKMILMALLTAWDQKWCQFALVIMPACEISNW